MQAIIVAAGEGRRLRSVINDRPKAMLEIQGQSLITRSVDHLMEAGITDIAVVVGYRRKMLIQHLEGFPITFYHNPAFATNNNMASLAYALPHIKDDFIYLHSDLIYDGQLLQMLINCPHPNTLLVEQKPCEAEDMKVRVESGRLVESSKDIPLQAAFGEWTGIAKFNPTFAEALAHKINTLVGQGNRMAYDTLAFTELVEEGDPIDILPFTGLPWVEIDTPEDLQRARELFETG
ncbi:MAG: phosphocholine cytidylyltransferase family protein [Fidelibacterota bacterium]|nr:MAG: phosphocholine cytidylyltransferase family protein [Candidatus Neomarinimicrobiota bacterium]